VSEREVTDAGGAHDRAPFTFPVEATSVLLFARALGDLDATLDEVSDRPVPVTFPISAAHVDPAYELRLRSDRPWFGSGKGNGMPRPSAGGGRRLHAEQHVEYARPVRPGETFEVRRRSGRTWEKSGSSGTLQFLESITELLDEHGHRVVTMRSVSVVTEAEER